MAGANSLRHGPDGNGRFGAFGGRFVAETLMPLILEVEQAYTPPAPIRPSPPSSPDCFATTSAGRARCGSPSGSPAISAARACSSSATS